MNPSSVTRGEEPTPGRTRQVLAIGFGLLVILIGFSGFSALKRANEIHAAISTLHEEDRRTEALLASLRSDLQLSAIDVRDFLLDPTANAEAAQAEILRRRAATAESLRQLQSLTRQAESERLQRMGAELDAYWKSIDPLFHWTAEQRRDGGSFLRREVLPRREAALDLTRQIEALTASSVRERRASIETRQRELPAYVARMIGGTITVGLFIALASIYRIVHLEKLAGLQHRKVREAEAELRNLSRQLVHAQEEERRSLSRELHDQIGQLLTAARIGIGNAEEKTGPSATAVRQQLEQVSRILEQSLRAVRDLAMGLRPAMLDDLGLGAALEWQARQHSRICGVPVAVHLDGELDQLPDEQRTCVYRVVQEALNNTAKYAGATEIQVDVTNRAGVLTICVRDNGKGFDPAGAQGHGLGLVGMKERARQLGGQLSLESAPGRGTTLTAMIPVPSMAAQRTQEATV